MTPGTFAEGVVEVAGGTVRYRQAGQGPALVHLQPAGALSLTPAHALLGRAFRVVVLEAPASPEAPLGPALDALGLDAFNLLATAAAAPAALAVALQSPARVLALVLESPVALDDGLARRLPEVTAPILVLLGTRDDQVPATARACQAQAPNGHLVLVYDAGPAIGADRPAAFAEVVTDFLERHEAFVISRADTVILP